ncbi:ABC transporter permease [Rhizobium sp. Leaf384]|nr:ABC transporter permease [Rhizobium sp. Leaf384]
MNTHTGSRRDWIVAYLFLLPFLAVYLVFLVYPLFSGFWISLHDWELVGNFREYIGFQNYRDLWADVLFWKTIRNTALFASITVPCMTALALALALAVRRPGRLYAVLRGVFFASSVFSVSVVTLVWRMVLDGDRGLLANLFRSVGIRPIGFLGEPFWAMPSLAVATLWWGVGLPMALFIAALNQIPQDIYEAAELDFASRWKVLRRITLPGIKRTFVLVLVLQIVLQFQMFGQAQLMTKGGPADQTRTIVQYIYDTGFRDWQIGYASAMAVVLFVLMFSISMVQLWLGSKED